MPSKTIGKIWIQTTTVRELMVDNRVEFVIYGGDDSDYILYLWSLENAFQIPSLFWFKLEVMTLSLNYFGWVSNAFQCHKKFRLLNEVKSSICKFSAIDFANFSGARWHFWMNTEHGKWVSAICFNCYRSGETTREVILSALKKYNVAVCVQ